MSAKNPVFNHAGRAAYELPKLLANLGNVDSGKPLTEVQRNTIDAIESHAFNATEFITSGMESVGRLMAIVGHGEVQVDASVLANLGDLMMHLAVEVQHLHEVESDMRAILRSSEIAQTNATPAAPGPEVRT
jgi:hypothetical protein